MTDAAASHIVGPDRGRERAVKGIVFTEFLEMVETAHSADMVDAVIADAAPPHGGAYTAVGTYPAAEMGALVGALARRSGTPAPELLRRFGRHVFGRFAVTYPDFFAGIDDVLDFLSRIESVIHIEVLKLYPDAELPTLETAATGPDGLRLTYRSPRCMADFAEGLIEGAGVHFRQPIAIERSLPRGTPAPELVFTVTRLP
jgi:hypothetical protein